LTLSRLQLALAQILRQNLWIAGVSYRNHGHRLESRRDLTGFARLLHIVSGHLVRLQSKGGGLEDEVLDS
jgi:hypothetical protein